MDSYTASPGHLLVPECSFDLKLGVWEYCSCVCYRVFFQHICQFEYTVYVLSQPWKRFSFSHIQSLFSYVS